MLIRTLLHRTALSPSEWLNSRIQDVASKMQFRMGHPSTITADGNIEAVEWIVMRDRQISIRCLAEELAIPKTTIHEIMDNQLGMKKVRTRWILKLLTPIHRANRVDCCHELLQ